MRTRRACWSRSGSCSASAAVVVLERLRAGSELRDRPVDQSNADRPDHGAGRRLDDPDPARDRAAAGQLRDHVRRRATATRRRPSTCSTSLDVSGSTDLNFLLQNGRPRIDANGNGTAR